MGSIDGIIVLASDGRPIVQSHFRHPLPTYPLLHIDHFNNVLSSTAYSGFSLAGPSSLAAGASSSSASGLKSIPRRAQDIRPVLWVPGIPYVPRSAADEDEQEDDDDEETDESNVWSKEHGATWVDDSNAMAEQGAALCHIEQGGLKFLAPISAEGDPLVPLAFLRTFVATLQDYLGEVSEEAVRDNFDVVYQLLEEMLDDGHPLTTEPNALRDIVLPPSFLARVVNAVGVGGLSSAAPPPMVSPIPWRRPNTRYSNNELYVDVIENLEGIVDNRGVPITLDLWGRIQCNAKLSGTPDLSMQFNSPQLLEDLSFHPCVRHRKWQKERVLSFVPPDGAFELATFRVGAPYAVPSEAAKRPAAVGTGPANGWDRSLPLSVKATLEAATSSGTGSFIIILQSRLPATRAIESLVVSFHLGDGAQSVDASTSGGGALASNGTAGAIATPAANGSFVYNPSTKVLKWEVPKLSSGDRPLMLSGTFVTTDRPARPSPAVSVQFSVPVYSLSGLKVTSLQVLNEPYKPFKGVRSMVTGDVEWRW